MRPPQPILKTLPARLGASQARALLGYAPHVGFEEGLRRTFDWYRESRLQAAAQKAAPFFRTQSAFTEEQVLEP